MNPLHNLTLLMAVMLFLKITETTFQPNTHCPSTCGNVTVPFPFGLSPNCYLNKSYAIFCDQTKNPPKPFLQNDVELLEISLPKHTLRVSKPVAGFCYSGKGTATESKSPSSRTLRTKFPISSTANKLTGVGCDTVAVLLNAEGRKYITGCEAICDGSDSVINGSCSGRGCCQTAIPPGREFTFAVRGLNLTGVSDFNPCSYAFLVEAAEYKFSKLDLKDLQKRETMPVVLDWSVGNSTCRAAEMDRSAYACKAYHSECQDMKGGIGYRCFCSEGFQGNPYLIDGCHDIDECKESNPCSRKCTNFPGNFYCSCPPGFEGDGLKNGTGCSPIAKDEGSVVLYILLGYYVHLKDQNILVYEFITNGSLFENIHIRCQLSWEVRLKIAAETAEALAYLHSATSTPIIHRDIKTANILLDDRYTAKVSDFGVSRLISRDHAQLTTMIQGTFGYLDPEYFRSNQLTEKSDVYSFGVVLAELLTSQKAISFDGEEGAVNLAMFFVNAMREDRIVQILDQRLVRDDTIHQLKQVAIIAEWCLRVKLQERPSMKEVAMDLEALRGSESRPWGEVDLNQEELGLTGYDSIKDQQALVSLSYGR